MFRTVWREIGCYRSGGWSVGRQADGSVYRDRDIEKVDLGPLFFF
jgi:hypothetical protein